MELTKLRLEFDEIIGYNNREFNDILWAWVKRNASNISNLVEARVSPTERNSFGQWILCEDKMPSVCESVIVCDPKQPRTCKVNEAFWDGEEWNFIRDGYKPIQITKWMPLPKP